MLTKVSKSFKWEMGHRLTFHEGLCRNVHGHTYRMRIEIEGEPDTNGIVKDYYDIEKAVKPFIDTLDHAFLVDDKDSVMIEFLNTNGLKHKIIPYFTTAENIVSYLMNEIYPVFANYGNLHSITMRVYETDDVFAEINMKLNKMLNL